MADPKPSSSNRAAIAAIALALAIPAEGLRRVAYYDPPKVLTVCYGHTGKDVDAQKVYSLDECRVLLDKDMNDAIDQVERCVPGLPAPVLGAFADATYNLGGKIVCDTKNSTAARMLKAGDLVGACNQLPRWDKAVVGGVLVSLPGLTKRRANEKEVCLTGVSQ